MIKPEVMSPVGYWPQLHTAIEAGADSVYFGLRHFSARAKVGFTLTELPEVMRTLHQRGVKGFLTFNTLVFDHELNEAAKGLAAIAEAGVDAIIVQDVGIAQLAQQIAPDLELHGSTQMSITNVDGIKLAQSFGVKRVVLARELSLTDIAKIRTQTDCELELFVHGALCVSYSGQCFSSEAWGGRSANRGQCAQACRLPYDLIVDDVQRDLGDKRYLLSPGDLYALQQVPEIVGLGISSLKIEGRYKDVNYVALTTQAYRQAVDAAWAGLDSAVSAQTEIALEQVYSRGLGDYFISGTDHQKVVDGRYPRHRGVFVGQVVSVLPEGVIVRPNPVHALSPLKAGDGIVFDSADWRSPEEKEEGGRIYQVEERRDGNLLLRFGNFAIDGWRIRPKDLVWRTHDPSLEKLTRPFTQANTPLRKQLVTADVTVHEGETLLLRLVLPSGVAVVVESAEPLATAQHHGTNETVIREQIGRMGNSPYQLENLTVDIVGNPFVPTSLLNQLRRQAVEALQKRQSIPTPIETHDPLAAVRAHLSTKPTQPETEKIPQLHLLIRTPAQLDAALALQPSTITLDYLDLYGLRPAVQKIKAQGCVARVATPRILKPGEEGILTFLLSLDSQLVVRATGMLEPLQGATLIGDFSLNAANQISAETFLQLGLTRITPTYDLNADQIYRLAKAIGGEKIEVVAYQHLPVFHTEHCVFCRFLSNGTDYTNCGRPCEEHQIGLRDLKGQIHPVMADVGCRNTVFGAVAQEGSLHLESWLSAGIRDYRLEFVHESAETITRIGRAFQETFQGTLSYSQLNRQLQELAPQGSAEGALFVPNDYLRLPVL